MMFAIPCPRDSIALFDVVSVISSTIRAVSNDSIKPTNASDKAYGKMIWSVSSENGTSGKKKLGNAASICPMSPMTRVSSEKTTVNTVIIVIATSGAGIAFVTRGNNKMMASDAATIAYMIQFCPSNCGSCAEKIKIANALTNPTMTDRGMNRNNLAIPKNPNVICRIPARIPAASK